MSGELFDRLEGQIATLLGKEAALYLPSGKLAQMTALKILTGRAGCTRIAIHPRAHLEEYEARAYQELWGLTAAPLGGYDRLPTPDDLSAIHEPLGAVSLELPMRRLGCLLPTWNQLIEFSEIAQQRNIFLHMDGARLWESQPYYQKPLHEIAGLFDTVYVALDKGLGGLAGAVLAGPQWVIDEARIWQRRAGGRALRSFPYLLSALKGLDERLPRMGAYHEKAKELAKSISDIPNIRVSPEPPHANAFLVSMTGDLTKANEARDTVASEMNIWLFDTTVDSIEQSTVRFEITVREAAFELDASQIGKAVSRFSELVGS
ncbi:MAG: threonine aldolase [Hyphomicrobiales bacterium]|nr:MAG: threonine aldolase [Hyphomicrobiales bacterium]